MAAPKGNRFWEARSSHGNNPKFENPEDLWAACVEYFNWVQENPLEEEKVFHTNGLITKATIGKMRAMSIEGLCIFLDVESRTWRIWRDEREDLIPIIARVEKVIYTQKFEGASADLLNANIIARDLKLADPQELNINGKLEHEHSAGELIASRIASLASRETKE